ncbi:leucine-rich repeat-containing protein 15-like [Parasteatoda tepidariorum]|uniref:leucine-rich repeat-containing protein 15-like n=1 Tax=Parasteatoda tepidariorum TaxID=114398 RepID=UPI00077FA2D9|nr:leucine-rich repeat-containing protein 15-like [Parasteatoda tepidariorum]
MLFSLTLSVFLVLGGHIVCDQNACPHSCYCDEKNEYVSCVGDGLQRYPEDVPETAVRLEIRNYVAPEISSKDFSHLLILEELKLQQSRIESIENSTFAMNGILGSLDLSQNALSILNAPIFRGLNYLRHLDLSSNFIDSSDDAFVDLMNLEQLNLRNNRLCSLTTHIFNGLHKVQYLNLDANNISSIEVGTFQYLTNLAHLIISNNPLATFSRLDFFGSRLQYIDISHVGLDRVPQSLTKFVRDLRLTKNNLTHISAGDFDSYPYLGLLVLDDNCVSEIENDALGRLEYLMRLWLNGNCLTKVPPNLPPSLTALYMEENKLTDLFSYSFKGLERLETLFLQRNEIRSVHPCAFCDLVNLKSLDLQANKIENLTNGAFMNLTQLETLDLSQNNLKVIESYAFSPLSRLSTLQMSRVPTVVEIGEGIFDSLHNLLILEVYDSLHLVHAIINSTRVLHGLHRVEELNIMHNSIVKLRSDFASFFPALKVIKISGNLWHCDESIKWLANWIKQSNVQFYSSYNIRCFTPSNIQFKPLMMLTDSDFDSSAGTSKTKQENVLTSTMTISFPSPSIMTTLTTLKESSEDDNITAIATTNVSTTIQYNNTDLDAKKPNVYDSTLFDTSEAVLNSTNFTSGDEHVMLPRISDDSRVNSEMESLNSGNGSVHSHSFTYSSIHGSEKSVANISSDIVLLQRRMLSSRLTETPYSWDSAVTVVVLSGGCFLLIVIACHLRIRQKHANVRRDSISYYPQKDEVSIVTDSARGQCGLGSRLYFIKENSTNVVDSSNGDSQLQELLLPNSSVENGYLY